MTSRFSTDEPEEPPLTDVLVSLESDSFFLVRDGSVVLQGSMSNYRQHSIGDQGLEFIPREESERSSREAIAPKTGQNRFAALAETMRNESGLENSGRATQSESVSRKKPAGLSALAGAVRSKESQAQKPSGMTVATGAIRSESQAQKPSSGLTAISGTVRNSDSQGQKPSGLSALAGAARSESQAQKLSGLMASTGVVRSESQAPKKSPALAALAGAVRGESQTQTKSPPSMAAMAGVLRSESQNQRSAPGLTALAGALRTESQNQKASAGLAALAGALRTESQNQKASAGLAALAGAIRNENQNRQASRGLEALGATMRSSNNSSNFSGNDSFYTSHEEGSIHNFDDNESQKQGVNYNNSRSGTDSLRNRSSQIINNPTPTAVGAMSAFRAAAMAKRWEKIAKRAAAQRKAQQQAESGCANELTPLKGEMPGGQPEEAPEEKETILEVLKDIIVGKFVSPLLLLAPFAYLAHRQQWGAIWIFWLNFFVMIPLAAILGDFTEEVALHTNQTIGGLVNATFGNAVEVVVAIQALLANEIRVVQASMIGSIFSNLLLVLGCCFFFGGLKYKEQTFNSTAATANMGLLALSSIALVLPTPFADYYNIQDEHVLTISRVAAIFLLSMYIQLLVFQLKTHAHLFDNDGGGEGEENEEEEEEEARIPMSVSLLGLCLTTLSVTVFSDFLVGSIDDFCESSGVSRTFVGLIILPIVGNAVEHITAVTVAMKDKMDLAMGGKSCSFTFVKPRVLADFFLSFFLFPSGCWIMYTDIAVCCSINRTCRVGLWEEYDIKFPALRNHSLRPFCGHCFNLPIKPKGKLVGRFAACHNVFDDCRWFLFRKRHQFLALAQKRLSHSWHSSNKTSS